MQNCSRRSRPTAQSQLASAPCAASPRLISFAPLPHTYQLTLSLFLSPPSPLLSFSLALSGIHASSRSFDSHYVFSSLKARAATAATAAVAATAALTPAPTLLFFQRKLDSSCTRVSGWKCREGETNLKMKEEREHHTTRRSNACDAQKV